MILAILAGAVIAAPVDLAWMSGSWTHEKDGVVTRETWLAPLGGAMSGAGQTNRPGRPARSEFMTITVGPQGLTFTAYVDGQPPTPFVAIASDPGSAVFENRAHDFPQRVMYRRCGENLCAGIEGVVAGKPRAEHWTYVRASAAE
ncbi:MAG: DUF6265 family protein [Phenylobacterium sp.]|uniref:DUF6265 family protein n=1 Tax=Phenylobacterium sp. TaxID=1871053 RepID=UPI002731BD17|nr:DUF6265 family protein [Phenylobacterium sp.]MDP2011744.1 DUF6265 family protein [Phenylobacterium sp.]